MENAKKFFEEVIRTEAAKELIASFKAPETEQERIEAYASIAGQLGIQLSAEEIQAYFAPAAEACASGELDDEELAQLVGGGENAGCKDTYMHEENCWWNDGCDQVWNEYDGYLCSAANTLSAWKRSLSKVRAICGSTNYNEAMMGKP